MTKRSIKGKKLPAKQLDYQVFKLFLRHPKKRLNAKQILKKLKINNSKPSVDEALARLAQKGKISEIKDGKFKLNPLTEGTTEPREVKRHQGYVDITRTGAGYIICEDLKSDVYVPAKKMLQAMDGDRVEVEVLKRFGPRLEGRITRIIERSTEQFIGDFQASRNFGFVVPDNHKIPFDIYVYPDEQGKATDGDKVLVKVLTWPERANKSPIGTIVKVLDKMDHHEVQMSSILVNNGFDIGFPHGVEQSASELPRTPTDEEIARRRDMRSVTTFTIDPATAKDFDDALSYQVLENGDTEIGVHIADVTHYVKEGSAIDKEAFKRSTSVYLVDRVAPMLPEVLSNELCSLRPNEDSLTFSAIFNYDKSSTLKNVWFGKTIIHSDHRYAYEEAQAVINGDEGPFRSELLALDRLAKILRKRRFKSGSIAFEAPEVQFELDENNHPVAIHTKERLDTHMLVEEFMLLANKEVAKYMTRKAHPPIPFVYRVHDLPDDEKLASYALFLKELGFQFLFDSPDQTRKSFNKLSAAARDNELLAFAEPFAVRTMSKAIYTTENIGHFGLGFDNYTHFTSPIRRYADVLVHRILERNLKEDYRVRQGELESKCQHVSNQERKAQEAERESIKYKQVEYAADRIGEIHEGIVSGMIDRGLFVELLHSRVEGMVEFDSLSTSYIVDDNRMKAKSPNGGSIFKIGDRIKVRIREVRISDKEVDLELIKDNE